MNIRKKLLSLSLTVIFLVTLLCGCNSNSIFQQAAVDVISSETFTETEPTEPPFEEYDITLMALGDNLIHMNVIATGKQEDGSLNYDFLFENISDFLETADIKIINQETPLAGNDLGFSGYPNFNSPTEIGDAIVKAGFNVVLHASNHSADKRVSGIDSCIDYWNTKPEVLLTGIHKPTENPEIPLLTIKDMTFAILNYTYGPNYETAPDSLSSRLNLLCAVNEETKQIDFTTLNPQVLEDIKTAKELADVVIVCPHWGTEYTTTPSGYQKTFALQMTEAGADVIIGTHPHVIQPVSMIEAENGNTALCYYSLGNYVSTQKNPQSMLEAMAWITFHVTEDGISVSLEKTGAIPMVCHYTAGPVRIENIYLLEEYTEEMASRHGIRSYGGVVLKHSDLTSWSNNVLGDWIISSEEVLNK